MKNETIFFDNTTADCVSFGRGKKNLVLIPGLGDGLKTVKGMALPLAYLYRAFAKEYRVYVFSRRNNLPDGFSTENMAADIKASLNILNIAECDLIGISQGGMIAQCLALQCPKKIRKLVLAVTSSKPNRLIEENILFWIEKARGNDYRALFIDTAEKTYTDAYLKKFRKFYGILSRIGAPKDFKRFIIQARSCLKHNQYERLDGIHIPTLVIGATDDEIVGVDSSREIAEKIQDSELYIYDGFGHGVYEEAKDFNARVLAFLRKELEGRRSRCEALYSGASERSD